VSKSKKANHGVETKVKVEVEVEVGEDGPLFECGGSEVGNSRARFEYSKAELENMIAMR